MLHRKIHINVISRALVVVLVVLAGACNRHAPDPAGSSTADTTAGNPLMPEIVITASRLPPDTRYAARAAQASSPPREAHVNRRGS
jgi:hypothetical protein